MPPKKKSKTSTPATLPCFATARLTIIGANPVQRKIWQKCGGPTFLKPSQVTQLTNDRDYVVVAAAVDASIIQTKKGAARVVTDRWLTASIERNAPALRNGRLTISTFKKLLRPPCHPKRRAKPAARRRRSPASPRHGSP